MQAGEQVARDSQAVLEAAQREQGFIKHAWVRDKEILNVLNEINDKLGILVTNKTGLAKVKYTGRDGEVSHFGYK